MKFTQHLSQNASKILAKQAAAVAKPKNKSLKPNNTNSKMNNNKNSKINNNKNSKIKSNNNSGNQKGVYRDRFGNTRFVFGGIEPDFKAKVHPPGTSPDIKEHNLIFKE